METKLYRLFAVDEEGNLLEEGKENFKYTGSVYHTPILLTGEKYARAKIFFKSREVKRNNTTGERECVVCKKVMHLNLMSQQRRIYCSGNCERVARKARTALRRSDQQ
jgi:hypothetical protein